MSYIELQLSERESSNSPISGVIAVKCPPLTMLPCFAWLVTASPIHATVVFTVTPPSTAFLRDMFMHIRYDVMQTRSDQATRVVS